MNKLNLSTLGVQEMSAAEMRSVDGGCLFEIICAAIVVVATVADAIWDLEWLETPADAFR